jgi:hypothetical protein
MEVNMTPDGPNLTDPIWQTPQDTNLPFPNTGSTLDHLEDRHQATSLDGWSELPLPKKIKTEIAAQLLSQLNDANINIRRIEYRSAGIFSRGMMLVRLAVPDDSLSYATRIAHDLLGSK